MTEGNMFEKLRWLKPVFRWLEVVGPIILIGLWIEGSYKWYGIAGLSIYIIYKVVVGVIALDRSGAITMMSIMMKQLWRKK